MERYYRLFEDTEENKLCYTTVFYEYRQSIETHILTELECRMQGCFEFAKMSAAMKENNIQPLDGEIFELILSLDDFLVFKDLVLDFKRSREAGYETLNLIQINAIKNYNRLLGERIIR